MNGPCVRRRCVGRNWGLIGARVQNNAMELAIVFNPPSLDPIEVSGRKEEL